MKFLNLFAGIGGNRTLWGDEHEITAVEHDTRIAYVYHKRFPNDDVIVTDAFSYLRAHFHEFDVIWASLRCTSHSKLQLCYSGEIYNGGRNIPPQIPDMRLYGVILFLKHHFRGEWVVENVQPFYDPLITPTTAVGRHVIWASKPIPPIKNKNDCWIQNQSDDEITRKMEHLGINIELRGKRFLSQVLNNCVHPKIGKYILDHLIGKVRQERLF